MHIRGEQMSKISDNIGIRDLTTCGTFSMRLHFIAKPCSVGSHQCITYYNDCEIVRLQTSTSHNKVISDLFCHQLSNSDIYVIFFYESKVFLKTRHLSLGQ